MTTASWIYVGLGAFALVLAAAGKRLGAGGTDPSLNPVDWLFGWLVDALPEALWRLFWLGVGLVMIFLGLADGGVV
jgi:hypothetical protein